jgi:hypothetical protein
MLDWSRPCGLSQSEASDRAPDQNHDLWRREAVTMPSKEAKTAREGPEAIAHGQEVLSNAEHG